MSVDQVGQIVDHDQNQPGVICFAGQVHIEVEKVPVVVHIIDHGSQRTFFLRDAVDEQLDQRVIFFPEGNRVPDPFMVMLIDPEQLLGCPVRINHCAVHAGQADGFFHVFQHILNLVG